MSYCDCTHQTNHTTHTTCMPSSSILALRQLGARVVSHGRYITFQLAEVAEPRRLFANILSLIARLRAPPAPA